ncbi:Hypothetical_protein [Hexamita inflata]|uniref:Hypothetical_protein n=1 Tax=Hexamita inflata TaxID=28002 RepID=A0AA86NNF4_9EUKA|nr:Hypothetical protein HINF_LOCUS9605 [Hexamita inflata]
MFNNVFVLKLQQETNQSIVQCNRLIVIGMKNNKYMVGILSIFETLTVSNVYLASITDKQVTFQEETQIIKHLMQWLVCACLDTQKPAKTYLIFILHKHIYYHLAQKQNVQIAFQRKATPQNRKQDNQFMTLFPGLNLDQIRNNANTQLPYSTKSCYQQKDLQNKLHWPERANGESVRKGSVMIREKG